MSKSTKYTASQPQYRFERDPTAETDHLYNLDADQTEQSGDNPLGEILLAARERAGWSRAELSKRTKIGQNSIVRYEKAGIDEEEGQYPPSYKLAILCWHLKIRPSKALIACLPPRYRQEGYAAFHDPVGHPMHDFMKAQYQELLHENHMYRVLFSKLFGPKPEKNSLAYERLLWLIGAAKEMHASQTRFDNIMTEKGQFVPLLRDFHDPGSPQFIVEDFVYKGTPEVGLVDGNEIAKLLGWETPDDLDVALWEKVNESFSARFHRDTELNKESPETGLAASPSSQDDK